VGAALELMLLLVKSRRHLGTLRPTLDAASAHVREAAARLPGVLVGRGVIQISGLVDTLLVSFVGTGANATFAYAQTLYLLPMSLLGTGEAAVSLPEMARDTAVADEQERHRKMRRRLGLTLTRVCVLAIPAMAVLMVFGEELINLLLRTGKFDSSSTERVAAAVRIYGLALVANASVRLFATTFFALGDTRLPARFAVVRVIASTAIALALLRSLGVIGVVTGAVCAGWLEALFLGWQLHRRIGGTGLAEVPWAKVATLAALTFGLPAGARALIPPSLVGGWLGALIVLGTVGGVFTVGATLLGLFDLRRLLRR